MLFRTPLLRSPAHQLASLKAKHIGNVEKLARTTLPVPKKLSDYVEEAAYVSDNFYDRLWLHGEETRTEALTRISHSLLLFPEVHPELLEERHFQWIHLNAWKWFDLLYSSPISCFNTHDDFIDKCAELESTERPMLPDLAVAVGMWERRKGLSDQSQRELDNFIHCYCLSRIGWRLLLAHHRQLVYEQQSPIVKDFRPHPVVLDCFARVRDICFDHYGVKPPFVVEGGTNVCFTYPPAHFSYTLIELLKNSMRATMDRHAGVPETHLPPVVLKILEDDERVRFAIHDEGGGVRKEDEPTIWRFGWTSLKDSPAVGRIIPLPENAEDIKFGQDHILAGWGCGLSLSRCYVQHFGGSLKLHSEFGHGVDLFIDLPKYGVEKILTKPLPDPNVFVPTV
jgi:hypothetical protein